MLVSVIIPTYNRKDFLIKALDSVLNQTYANIEVLIIDDASTDDTKNSILKYNDNRIKYFKNPTNLHAAESRNIGIKKSSGELIAFLDDDDIWLNDKIEKQVKLFKDNDIGIVYCGIKLIFESYDLSYNTKPNLKGKVYKKMLINNYIGATPCVMASKEALVSVANDQNKYFDSSFPAREEYDLWIRISKKWKVDYLEEPLVKQFYRNTIDRISTDINNYINAINLLNKKYEIDVNKLLSSKEKKERLVAQNFFLAAQAIKISNSKLAQKFYLKAFKTNKQIKTLIIYLACFLGSKFIIKLRYYLK